MAFNCAHEFHCVLDHNRQRVATTCARQPQQKRAHVISLPQPNHRKGKKGKVCSRRERSGMRGAYIVASLCVGPEGSERKEKDNLRVSVVCEHSVKSKGAKIACCP